jgi:pentatricopeptide repeat protein
MQSANIPLDGFSISTMLKAAKRSHDRKTVERVLSLLDHAEVDFSKDEVLLNCVLDASVKFGDKKRVSDLLEVQAKAGTSPSVHSYGILIRAAGFANDMRRCRELWHEMVEERRFTPSELVLGCMTNSLVQAGCIDEAFSLVKEWTSRVQPNRVVFAILWRGFSDSNRSERSLEVLEEMRSTGVPISSDVYAQLLECFVRNGKSDAVDVLVKQMDAAGIEYDAGMITNLTKHFCAVGAFEECLKLLKASGRHNKKSCHRRAQTLAFDKLLEGHVNAQRYTEGAALVDAMDEYDVQPSRFTLASVVTLWGCSQQLDRAFKAVETMTKKYNILPNNLVRTCLLSACLANNDISSAFRVFDVIKATNTGPDCAAFEALIKGSSRLGWHKECVRLVEEACGLSDVKPNFSPRDLDVSVLEYMAANLRKAGLMESIGDPLFKRLRHLRVIVKPPR